MPSASDFKPSRLFSLGDDDDPKEGTPVRMVGTWVDTVHTKPGQPAERGFGGRLMFYGKKEQKPILVDGQLVVYAFDEMGRAVTDNKPTRRYVFPPDQLPLHMSMSELGASYSFFLPWDEVGGPQTEVSLICRFEPKGGAVITSEQTKHLLPGRIPATPQVADGKPPRLPEGVPYRPAQPTLESMQASRTIDPGVQQASYVSAIPNNVPAAAVEGAAPISATQMNTTTIPLPHHYRLPVDRPLVPGVAPAFGNPPLVIAPQNANQQQIPQQPLQPRILQQLGNGQHATPQVQSAVPQAMPTASALAAPITSTTSAPPAIAGTFNRAAAQPTQPAAQPTRLGFSALPTRQSIAPTVLMPTTYLQPAQSSGITAPYQPQVSPVQPVAQQSHGATATRTITWNTVQPAQPPALRQPTAFTPALQQPGGVQPAAAPMWPATSTGMSTAANYPAGATVGQAF